MSQVQNIKFKIADLRILAFKTKRIIKTRQASIDRWNEDWKMGTLMEGEQREKNQEKEHVNFGTGQRKHYYLTRNILTLTKFFVWFYHVSVLNYI